MKVERKNISNLLFPFDDIEVSQPKEAVQYLKILRELRLGSTFSVSSDGVLTSTGALLTTPILTTPTFTALDATVGTGLIWYPIINPGLSWFANKTSWSGVNSFVTAGYYLELDFSSIVPVGTRAVIVTLNNLGDGGWVYWKAEGDTNISNTPHSDEELSHGQGWSGSTIGQTVQVAININSSTRKARMTVATATQDIYISYPSWVGK